MPKARNVVALLCALALFIETGCSASETRDPKTTAAPEIELTADKSVAVPRSVRALFGQCVEKAPLQDYRRRQRLRIWNSTALEDSWGYPQDKPLLDPVEFQQPATFVLVLKENKELIPGYSVDFNPNLPAYTLSWNLCVVHWPENEMIGTVTTPVFSPLNDQTIDVNEFFRRSFRSWIERLLPAP